MVSDVRNRLYCWLYMKQVASKEEAIPLEASYRHCPVNPFHRELQKLLVEFYDNVYWAEGRWRFGLMENR
jgi:hypothetical protein